MRTFLREAECVLCGIFGRPRDEKTEKSGVKTEEREFLNEEAAEGNPHTHKKKARVIIVRILVHRK